MERIAGIEGGTLECAIWDVAGRALWFVDIPGAKLHRLDPASGDLKIWTMPQHIGCFALREKGGAVVALRDGLYAFDFATGACAPIIRCGPSAASWTSASSAGRSRTATAPTGTCPPTPRLC